MFWGAVGTILCGGLSAGEVSRFGLLSARLLKKLLTIGPATIQIARVGIGASVLAKKVCYINVAIGVQKFRFMSHVCLVAGFLPGAQRGGTRVKKNLSRFPPPPFPKMTCCFGGAGPGALGHSSFFPLGKRG